MYMLIEHPDIERRLREEILTTIGSERSPTIEDLRKLRYLKAFLNGMYGNATAKDGD
jgi:hypothetical protein